MSNRFQGGFIRPGYNPLRVPNAPTIGTATAPTATTASVPFTAPSCVGGGAITGYTAVSSPGCKVGTATSSPITVSCLTTGTAYTFRVFATNSFGPSAYSASSNSVTPSVAPGQQAYTTAGTYSWVAPAGVTSVSVVAVGGGGGSNGNGDGGSGGGLGWKNSISVTPGQSYTVVAGAANGGTSYFISKCTVSGGGASSGPSSGSRGNYVGDGGGFGGQGGNAFSLFTAGGGGAGGYSGNGGNGTNSNGGGVGNGSGGGGGGGGSPGTLYDGGGGGGGVGILGQGSNGVAGICNTGGTGGSGGTTGATGASTNGGNGGLYGGGGGGGGGFGGTPGRGAVRIIWPGCSRKFPSTCTGDK